MSIVRQRSVGAVVIAFALCVCASPALAQRPRPDRPYRGLFGGNGAYPNSAQQLDLNVSLSGAYDDNVLADQGQGGIDPRFQKSGGYGNGSLSLDYTRRAGRATFDFTGGTSYRYYPSMKELNGYSYFASIGFSAKLTARTTLRATESGGYTPYFTFGLFPGLTTVAPGDVAPLTPQQPLVHQTAAVASSSAALDHRLTPRASLTADYTFTYTDYQAQLRPYTNYGAGAGFSLRTSPRSSLRIGYHYRRGTFGYQVVDRPVVSHDLDIGLDYSRPLSRSRKIVVGFTTGSSVYRSFDRLNPTAATPDAVATPAPSISAADWYRRTHYTATGSAFLTWQIRRSWNARADYRRGLQFVEGFPDPFFADSVSAVVAGFFGSRSRLNFSAAYTNGEVGISVNARPYTTATAIANYQFALTRQTALFAEYDYFHYQFDPTVPLPPGMNRGLDRQSVRGGVNLWLPLLR